MFSDSRIHSTLKNNDFTFIKLAKDIVSDILDLLRYKDTPSTLHICSKSRHTMQDFACDNSRSINAEYGQICKARR